VPSTDRVLRLLQQRTLLGDERDGELVIDPVRLYPLPVFLIA